MQYKVAKPSRKVSEPEHLLSYNKVKRWLGVVDGCQAEGATWRPRARHTDMGRRPRAAANTYWMCIARYFGEVQLGFWVLTPARLFQAGGKVLGKVQFSG